MLLAQPLNLKIRCLGDDKSLLVLDALKDKYALAIHKIKLSRERQANQFLTYPITEFNVGDKLLLQNHVRVVWDPKCDGTYHVVSVMGQKLELTDKLIRFIRLMSKMSRSQTSLINL